LSTAAFCQTSSSSRPSITGAFANFGTVIGFDFSGGTTTVLLSGLGGSVFLSLFDLPLSALGLAEGVADG
jgi:hypothetical protein